MSPKRRGIVEPQSFVMIRILDDVDPRLRRSGYAAWLDVPARRGTRLAVAAYPKRSYGIMFTSSLGVCYPAVMSSTSLPISGVNDLGAESALQ